MGAGMGAGIEVGTGDGQGPVRLALPRRMREHLGHLETDVDVEWFHGRDEMTAAAGRAEVLWYQWDPRELGPVVEGSRALRCVSSVSAGVDRGPLRALR